MYCTFTCSKFNNGNLDEPESNDELNDLESDLEEKRKKLRDILELIRELESERIKKKRRNRNMVNQTHTAVDQMNYSTSQLHQTNLYTSYKPRYIIPMCLRSDKISVQIRNKLAADKYSVPMSAKYSDYRRTYNINC